MPQRLLRPSIRQSKRFNRLAFICQSFYIRLVTLVDDYGRYEADPELLRSEAFPYGDENGKIIPVSQIETLISSLMSSEMVEIYEVGGSKYLQLTRWKERARSESRFPDPSCGHLLSNDSKCQQMIASPPSPQPTPTPTPGDSKCQQNGQWHPNDEQLALNGFFKRRPTTVWSDGELKAWKKLTPIRPDELEVMKRYYHAVLPENSDYRRRDLITLLNNWNGELDRASKFKSPKPF